MKTIKVTKEVVTYKSITLQKPTLTHLGSMNFCKGVKTADCSGIKCAECLWYPHHANIVLKLLQDLGDE